MHTHKKLQFGDLPLFYKSCSVSNCYFNGFVVLLFPQQAFFSTRGVVTRAVCSDSYHNSCKIFFLCKRNGALRRTFDVRCCAANLSWTYLWLHCACLLRYEQNVKVNTDMGCYPWTENPTHTHLRATISLDMQRNNIVRLGFQMASFHKNVLMNCVGTYVEQLCTN